MKSVNPHKIQSTGTVPLTHNSLYHLYTTTYIYYTWRGLKSIQDYSKISEVLKKNKHPISACET